ncbi:MAG: hypothetical protein CSA19_01705, partial [Deltaproteobacteria bacterium]
EKAGDREGFLQKMHQAEQLLFARAEDMSARLGDFDETEYLENGYLYGIYLLIKEGNLPEARQKLSKIQGDFGKSSEYLITLAKIYTKLDAKKAEKIFQKILDEEGNEHLLSRAREELGLFYYAEGRFAEAAEFLGMKLQTDEKRTFEPDLFDDQGRVKLARAYLHQHRWIKSQIEYAKAQVDATRNKLSHKITI